MKVNRSVILCIGVSVLLAACTANPDNTVAVVNGTKITKTMYEGTLNNLILQQKQLNPNFQDNEQTRLVLGRAALERLITNEVLAQAAAKAHISADKADIDQNIDALRKLFSVDAQGNPLNEQETNKKFEEKLKTDGITLKQLENNIGKELNTKLFLKDLSAKQKVELNEEFLHQFYDNTMAVLANDKNKIKTFTSQELALIMPFAAEVKKATAARASVSAIFLATPEKMSAEELTKKKELAKKIVQQLKNKKITFVQAIEKYSDDKNALRTNGEQLVLKGTLPQNLDKAVFGAALGTIEGPLTEKDGIYILRVNQKRVETPLTYEQLRGDIINYLGSLQLKQQLQQQVKDLVAAAKVEILLPQYSLKDTQTPAPAAQK